MKNKLFIFIYFLSCILSCKKNDHSPVVPTPVVVDVLKEENIRLSAAVTNQTAEAYVSGVIKAEDGQLLSNVSVSCGAGTVTTNSKGAFQFPLKLTLNKNYAVITATLNGYLNGIRTFTPNASGKANHYFEIKLLKEGAEKIVDAAGGTVVLDNKISLTFPDAAVVTASGATYTGQYKVSARYIDPATDNFFETMPGLLAGLNDQNQVQAIQSFGMANVQLKDMSGNALQIAAGKKVKMVLPASADAAATIPLWHFNEQYGLWIKAGIATKTGDTYTTEVNHFSIWNLDLEINSSRLDLQFNDAKGNALSGMQVMAYTQSRNKLASFFTDNEGKATLINCPAIEPLLLKTIFDCDTIINTLTPLSVSRSETVVLQTTTNIKSYFITGKLTACDDAPLANQPFQIAIQGNGKAIPGVTDVQGQYSLNTSFCNSKDSITIQAYSFINNQYLYAPANTFAGNSIVYNTRVCDSASNVSDNFVVVFPDKELDKLIRKIINKPIEAILYRDIKNLNSVRTTYNNQELIESIDGIQFCTNLDTLSLYTKNLNDLTPLQNLNKLRLLYLFADTTTHIIELSPLQKIKQLEGLSLVGFKLTDISPLQELVQLKNLNISSNPVSDITNLKNLVNLETLAAGNCQISNLTSLQSLLKLKSLVLNDNPLSNINSLQSLSLLKHLDLSNNKDLDTIVLQNLVQLQDLLMTNTGISNIHFVGKIKQLQYLELSDNQIDDLSILKNLDILEYLYLNNNNIFSLLPLQNLQLLHYLKLDYNNVSDITPLVNGVNNLRYLEIVNQSSGILTQSQKDSFIASHPNTSILWD